MAITVSIEIYQDDDGLFRYVFLDFNGEKWGPSVGYKSRSAARISIDRTLAASIDVRARDDV